MKKIILFLILIGSVWDLAYAGNFVYPFVQVAVPKCRFSAWSSLGDDCKMPIPKIINANYTAFKSDSNFRKIYSILWGSTYNYWWDVWNGSHPWVDIATSIGTPIRSIWDWVVITAWFLSGWWNTVVIRHTLSNWKYIYSNYAHMSKIIAVKWTIKAWDPVWEVWATWNAYWNHVHFQIDIWSGNHPYWFPSACAKWISEMDLVNNWTCRESLLANTIDPIIFLENNGSFKDVSDIQAKQSETINIDSKSIESRQQILDEEVDDFIKWHGISLNTWVSWDNLELWLGYITKLSVNYYNKPYSWNLPESWLTFEYDNSALKIFPDKLLTIDSWTRDIIITWLKTWKYSINLKLWKRVISTVTLTIYKKNELSNPTDAIISTKTKIALMDEKMSWVVFRTKYWSNQLYIPYDWTYKLKLISWNAKFCNVSNKTIKTCNIYELVNELTFRYEDTFNGALIFNIIPFDFTPIKLAIIKNWDKKPLAMTDYNIAVSNPINFNNSYSYFNEDIDALKKWLLKLNNWYLLQDRDLLWKQAKDIINNYLSYEFLRAWDDMAKKAIIISKLKQINKNFVNIDDYKLISRWEFSKLIFDNLWVSLLKNSDKILLDEAWNYKDYITTLRENYNFSWKDQFGPRYFQPEKVITIWEALFLANKINTGFWIQFAYNKN